MSEVNAYVAEENGQLVLHDPTAEGVIAAVEHYNRGIAYENCQKIYEQNSERVQYFRQRFDEKGYDPTKCCIVIIQIDDQYGNVIGNTLMPGQNWQVFRDQGLEPFARGIADRKYVHDAIEVFDQKAASDLDMLDYATVVVANSVARVFAV